MKKNINIINKSTPLNHKFVNPARMCGYYGGRVSDWWCHLRKHLGINESITTFCIKVGGQCAPPGVCMQSLIPPSLLKFVHLLHLNQSGVQDLISNLTYAHAGTL